MGIKKTLDYKDMFDVDLIRTNIAADDKTEVLRIIAGLAVTSEKLPDDVREEFIFDQLLARESVGSTGFGHGLAIPHCHLEAAEDFIIGCLTLPDGVDFNSQDARPVKIVPFIIAPASAKRHHIRVLSRLSIALSTTEAVEEVLECSTPRETLETLLELSHVQPHPQRTPRRSLVHIFLEGENLLHPVLEVLVGVGVTSLQVIETRSSASYLSNISLFAGLWNDSEAEFSKTIIALLDARLGNELIRRIEHVTGPLEERNDFALCMQEVQYAGGQIGLE